MKNATLFSMTVVSALSLVVAQPATAQITPNHVYQLVDSVYQELDVLHERDFSKAPDIVFELAPRKPRHVLQKAQEAYIKIQKFRKINGLSEHPIVPIPVRKVVPADVKESVQRVADGLVELRALYKIDDVPAAPLPSDKKPTHVYKRLADVSASLDALGLPAVVPNDVYRVAETIVLDLKQITNHLGIDAVIKRKSYKGKKPADVYEETYILLQKLQTLTQNPTYSIAGGVVLSPKPKGNISPWHVMNAMGDAMAEIGAIKYTIKAQTPTKFAPLSAGKNPSDVYSVVKQAQAFVDTLIAGANVPKSIKRNRRSPSVLTN